MIKSLSVLIMAGGSGSRLWPTSRSMRPKQFLALNNDMTMLQETVERLSDLEIDTCITICNEDHRFFVAQQLKEINITSKIILEPEGRNTAPAIALAALAEKDSLLLVLSADHVIQDPNSFCESVMKAIPVAESGKLVTFGVVPDKPHTGYGYIKAGSDSKDNFSFNVDQFVEKPSLDKAKEFLESGNYYWNSGMFLFKARKYLDELHHFAPSIYLSCKQAMDKSVIDTDFIRPSPDIFKSCPADSIDFAVMEKTNEAEVVPVDIGWSDLGSWSALWDISTKDSNGNFLDGDVITLNTKNSYIKTEQQLVSVIGLDNVVIIVSKDSVMVCDKDSTEDVKLITNKLKDNNRPEWQLGREVHRPWGKYDSVDSGEGFQVKRLTVYPGAKLSVQMHHHRSEHWVVVSGEARVHYGENFIDLKINESTYHDIEVTHALENIGDINLELIEVQVGDYLGEDDIVRFDDLYGRIPKS